MDGHWAPDPALRHRLRYWDGRGWTPWVADEQEVIIDAGPPPTASSPSAPLGVGAPLLPPSRGWFSDPSAPRERRYFDGLAWTEHRHSHRATISPRMLLLLAGALLALSVIAFVAGMVVSGMDTRPVSEFESQLARILLIAGLIAFPLACITGVIAAIWAWVLNTPPRGGGGGM